MDDIVENKKLKDEEIVERMARTIDGDRIFVDRSTIRDYVKKGSRAQPSLSVYISKYLRLVKDLKFNIKVSPLTEEEAMGLFLRGLQNDEIKDELKKRFRLRSKEEWTITKLVELVKCIEDDLGTDTFALAEIRAEEFMGSHSINDRAEKFMSNAGPKYTDIEIDELCQGIQDMKIAWALKTIPRNQSFNSRSGDVRAMMHESLPSGENSIRNSENDK